MSEQQTPQQDGIESVNDALSKTEQSIERYQKQSIMIVIGCIFVVCGIFAIRHFYYVPREARAQEELFRGEYYFQNHQLPDAINGHGGD